MERLLRLAILTLVFLVQIQVFGQEVSYNRDSVEKILESQQGAVQRARSYFYIGNSYFLTQNDLAIENYEKAYQYAKLSAEYLLLSNITIQLSVSYQFIDPKKSAEYAVLGVDFAEKSEDSHAIVSAHILMGNTRRASGELDQALEEYMYCLEIEESEEDTLGMARLYNNIGIVYMMSGKYDIGIEYWLDALDIKLLFGDLISASSTMANIALYYKDIGRYEEAQEFLDDALEINLEFRDFEAVAFNYTILGQLYQRQGKLRLSIDRFNLALDYCDSNGAYFYKEEALVGLAEVYSKLGNFKSAYERQVEYTTLLKEQFSEDNSRVTRELTAKFENKQKQKELELLKDVNEAQDAKIKEEEANIALKEENNRYLWFGLLLSVIALFSIIFVLYRVRKGKTEIEQQKHLVEEKNKEITDSISYAKRLQDAILPLDANLKNLLPNNFVLYLPKDIVAGDFYWLEKVEGKVLIAAADCTGHGVPGAMVSVVCHNALNRATREFGLRKPGEILDKVTDLVIETFDKSEDEVKDGMDIVLCSIDLSNQEVSYAGANNSLYFLRQGATEIEELKADKQPVGVYVNRKEFETKELKLNKGDILYLFTDGFADQFGGEKGKKMKYKPFKRILVASSQLSPDEQKQELSDKFHTWMEGYEQVDDVCVIGIRL